MFTSMTFTQQITHNYQPRIGEYENMPKTILIVENSQVAREALGTWLGIIFPHHHIIEAASGEVAAEIAGIELPEVIIMDIQLAQIDGIEIIRRIRANGHPAQIAVLTLYDDGAYRAAVTAAGANAVVSKHDMNSKLLPVLKEWLLDEQENDDAI